DKPLSSAIVEDKLKRGEIIARVTTWGEEAMKAVDDAGAHAVGVVYLNDLKLECNRGYRSYVDEKAGITVFERTPFITKIFDKQDWYGRDYHAKLHLTNPTTVMLHKDQSMGNCGWASAKMVLRAVFYAQLLKKGYTAEEAESVSYRMYKIFTKEDRLEAIK